MSLPDSFNRFCRDRVMFSKGVDRQFPALVVVDETDVFAAQRLQGVKNAIAEEGAQLQKQEAGGGKTYFHLLASARQLAIIDLHDLMATKDDAVMQPTKTVVRFKHPVRALVSALVK